MAATKGIDADVAGAILDGTPIDWSSAASRADEAERSLLDPLRVVSALADLHRSLPQEALETYESMAARGTAPPRLESWGHLRVVELIGRGASGDVYRAWDTRLDREVALKLMPARSAKTSAAASTIIDEGRLLARVRHTNVVTIYGAERIDGRVGLWMELVRGRTLHQVLEQGDALSAAEVVRVGTQVCEAVAAVHGAGLLHRDIKAHNVMLADDGRAVLMDFGTGRELGDSPAGTPAGTPLYLAPELLRGEPASVRSDVYSIGVLLYYLLTRSYPVRGRSVRDLLHAHERDDRTPLRAARSDLPTKLGRIVDRAIDPRPERRYRSAAGLAADLTALAPGAGRAKLAKFAAMAAAVMLVSWIAVELRGRWTGRSSPTRAAIGEAGIRPASGAPAPIENPAVAVLPFLNLGAGPDSDSFVDGLTIEILHNLAAIEGLQVRSQVSSFSFKEKASNLADVSEKLGVNLVLEGSVARVDKRLRVTVQLVQVDGNAPLWSEKFDRDVKDVFAIQDEISRAIVNRLRLTLGGRQRRYNTNVEAYDLYLKARALGARRGIVDPTRAIDLYNQVIARDSSFAPAYAGLVDAYAYLSVPTYQVELDWRTANGLMRTAAARALQLDPFLAEAHAAMGVVQARDWEWSTSEESFRRAIELAPGLTQSYTNYSFFTLRPLGKFEEAERLLRSALNNDPLSLDLWREIGQVQFTTGRYEEAIRTFRRVLAVDPDFPFVTGNLARAQVFAGRLSEALALFEQSERENRPAPHYRAQAYIRMGRRAEVEKLAGDNRSFPFRQVLIYAALGDADRAFEALDRTLVREAQRVPLLLTWPEMAGLRADPRFEAVRKRLKLP